MESVWCREVYGCQNGQNCSRKKTETHTRCTQFLLKFMGKTNINKSTEHKVSVLYRNSFFFIARRLTSLHKFSEDNLSNSHLKLLIEEFLFQWSTSMDYLYNNTVMDGSVIPWFCLSVCLSVRYRNHFPVVRFQNQAHIWNPHETGHVFKTIWGAAGGRNLGRRRRSKSFFFSSPKAA